MFFEFHFLKYLPNHLNVVEIDQTKEFDQDTDTPLLDTSLFPDQHLDSLKVNASQLK
jgi:hypothetical protein